MFMPRTLNCFLKTNTNSASIKTAPSNPNTALGRASGATPSPGHGVARWTEIFKELKAANYKGVVSIELEDENFNTSESGEKAGLMHSLNYLQGA